MIILSSNSFLKLGIKSLISDVRFNADNSILIFDAFKHIYVSFSVCRVDSNSLDLFSVLSSELRFPKADRMYTTNFWSSFFSCIQRAMVVKTSYKNNALTSQEKDILLALCKNKSNSEIERLFGKKKSTIQNKKNYALHKLGFKNLNDFYMTQCLWEKATGYL